MSKSINTLLEGNKEWVEGILKTKPNFFKQLEAEQSPSFLWIGCSDSRVPATEITNALPGTIFVQRNIANMVVHTDSNLLSVVHYAIKVLSVKHIIVCGHYGCGGIRAAMSNESYGFLDNWLMHIKDVYRLHHDELDIIGSPEKKENRFVELNIIEQVKNLAKVSFIQEEWDKGEFPYIHGWIYSLKNGLIKDLNISMNSNKDLGKVYQYEKRKDE
ncbi:MAG: carbonic anhydrase [Gammaproteobacteria bacterium RIFCSPHIGHO2_12_FULL_41_15]|nr:MAG: carbonic anhydrase [Gammaproteobacteria bacterium RIFCSPHIGHO2_12_FULL_41_15]